MASNDIAVVIGASGGIGSALCKALEKGGRFAQVIRLSRFLKPGGLVMFTLKVPRVESVKEPCALFREIVATATAGGLALFAQTHLTYNRHEFTLFFEATR